ncbi:hypothetical protein NJB1604_25160 [Mycobacterium marinum]|uniref:hypothetical protein n=1 Tax=Mycobacterium marinum TaxID=1781 RepID=UPI0021C3A600|nr:hypothetical protein [Mycobacterium marinum]GJO45773.1 hypothetical protein NJB1604_25160 [Mycobacterium marinum]
MFADPSDGECVVEWIKPHDRRHAFAVMSLSTGEHYKAVARILGHASFVTTPTVYTDNITEGDGGKAAPLGGDARRATWCRCVADPV